MPDEESLNREVEEAREAIVDHAIRYAVLRIGTGSMGLRESIDDFEAAVRKDERERVYEEIGWSRAGATYGLPYEASPAEGGTEG